MPTTWYLDYAGGSLNNAGDSFAVTLTGTDFVSAGTTTMTKATGGLTGLDGRKIYIVGIGGRTINSVESDISMTLNASVTTGTYTANVGGRRTTMNSFTTTDCQGYAAGDTVKCKASPAPTSCSVTGNFGDCSPTVIPYGATTDVADCETAFTASANVTATADTTVFKVGSKSAKIDIAAGLTTGLAAYFATGTLDLSASQILRFWFRQSAGTNIVSGDLSIRLCSDVAGVTAVNTFTVPALPIGGSAAGAKDVWVPMTVDLGSACGASIQSIAIYVDIDRGAQTFYFDDFKVAVAPNLNKTIHLCNSAFTASANVTCTTSSQAKIGGASSSISVADAFTTGLAGYKALGATYDFSAYKQISFLIRQSSGTLLATGGMSICLCSDTVGATPVDTLAIPALTGSATGQWHRVTIDKGSALGSSIQSIALYVDTDAGAQLILLNDMVACKDSTSSDAISLQSLIGVPNSTGAGGDGSQTWYCIRSINANTITLETGPNADAATNSRGYYDGGANVGFFTVYKRETIKTAYVASSSTAVQSPQISGSLGSLVAWSGGWNRTDMSTQTDETLFDGGNGLGTGISTGSTTYNSFDKFGAVRYSTGIGPSSGTLTTVSNFYGNCCDSGIVYHTSWSLSNVWTCNNSSRGITRLSSGGNNLTTTNVITNNNASDGFLLDNYNGVMTTTTACNNTGGGGTSANSQNMAMNTITCLRNGSVAFGPGGLRNILNTYTFTGNASNAINAITSDSLFINGTSTNNNGTFANVGNNLFTVAYLYNATISDTTEFVNLAAWSNGLICSTRHDNTDNNHWGFTDGGTFNSQVSVRHTASGIAWQMNPTSANRSATYPLKMSLPPMTVPASSTTIKVWLRRTNTGLTMKLVCPGGRLPGVASDVSTSMTAAADTWEEVSIAITPTSAGVVELEVWAYGGTTYTGYIDDMTCGGVAVPLDQGWNGQPWTDAVVSAGGGSAGGGCVVGSPIIKGCAA